MSNSIELTVLVSADDGDSEALDRTTRHLRAELQDLPIDSASMATEGAPPVGAKAGEVITLGALTLSLAPVVVPALIDFLKSWMARKDGRTVVIRTKTGDVSTEVEIKAPLSESAIAAFVERLAPKKAPAEEAL